jgi:hypothetical protein
MLTMKNNGHSTIMNNPILAAKNRSTFEETHGIKVLNWDTIPTMVPLDDRHGLPSPVKAEIEHICKGCKNQVVKTVMWRPRTETPALLCEACLQAQDEAFYGVKISNWPEVPKISKGPRKGLAVPGEAILAYQCPGCGREARIEAFQPSRPLDVRCLGCQTGDPSRHTPGDLVRVAPGAGGIPKSDEWRKKMSERQQGLKNLRPTDEQKASFEESFGAKLTNWDDIKIQATGDHKGWPRMRETLRYNCTKCGDNTKKLMTSKVMDYSYRNRCEHCNKSDQSIALNSIAAYQRPETRKKSSETWIANAKNPGTRENTIQREAIEKILGTRVKNWESLRFTVNGLPAIKTLVTDGYKETHRLSQGLIFDCISCGRESVLIFNGIQKFPSICKNCTAAISSAGRSKVYRSKPEIEIDDYIKSLGQNTVPGSYEVTPPYQIDIYVPDKKVGIEYHGLYWHSSEQQKDRCYHLKKSIQAEKRGVRLIQIFEDEWKFQKDIVKSRLRQIMGVQGKSYGARECDLIEVDPVQRKEFYEKNHIQGDVPAQAAYGLVKDGEIVACMSFGRRWTATSIPDDEGCELLRFAAIGSIPGGASRLLKAWMEKNPGVSLLSYADRRWSNGGLYRSLGFAQIGESSPACWYVEDGRRVSPKHYRRILENIENEEDKSSKEILEELGVLHIYDCGSLKFRLDPKIPSPNSP